MFSVPSWVKVWREGVSPQLSTAELEALQRGLADDDPSIVQHVTTDPCPIHTHQDLPIRAACAIAYAVWRGRTAPIGQEAKVGEVEDRFAQLCLGCDRRLGEERSARWLLNWWDETPRQTARRALLAEVTVALAARVPAGRRFVA